MDEKHILQSPKCSGNDFFNYKGFFSIAFHAVVDADYNSRVFKDTVIYPKMQNYRLDLPPAKPLPNRQKEVPLCICS